VSGTWKKGRRRQRHKDQQRRRDQKSGARAISASNPSAHRKSRLAFLMARDNGQCRICGCEVYMGLHDGQSATCDHVVPMSRGGVDHPSNWQLACRRCNRAKGDSMPEDEEKTA
jgi:5-methylcytosine-specific restriction endonuclease McrA